MPTILRNERNESNQINNNIDMDINYLNFNALDIINSKDSYIEDNILKDLESKST